MNKIYKLVWSKTKNMYVAVCEFAKSHTKASSLVKNMKILNLSLAINLMLNFGLFTVDMGINTAEAADRIWLSKNFITVSSEEFFQSNKYTYVALDNGQDNYEATGSTVSYLATDTTTGKTYLAVASAMNTDAGYPWSENEVTLYDGTLYTNGGIGGTTYTAGDGITISNETISAIAGTNVTVNSNGISVTGNGSVASGNTGLIDGGKLYAEVRPSDNGNYEENFSILL